MKMTGAEFIDWPNKAVTLLGMSGVGKTTLANSLPKSKWFHYSGDYRIGTKYLAEPILDNIKRQAMQVDFLRDLLRSDSIYIASNITVHNLVSVATFLGKIGSVDSGGLSVEEFKERQRLHRSAEIGAMRDVAQFIEKARKIYGYKHFINDAGGSICELDDERTIEILAEHTLILYLSTDEAMEKKMIQRAIEDPKPMYYQEDFLDQQLSLYLAEVGLSDPGEIVPDDFVRWIFPRHVEHRRPKYQAIADAFGYTIDARAAEKVERDSDFLKLIADALG
jgi:GTPase SAR1 family protein|tara:strand:+ start:26 stop:862 length:837 start_codon:yes stop_codon:yes gene_type:complete